MSKLQKLMEETLQAIAADRGDAKQLLDDVAVYLGKDAARYASTGMTAAKYLEVLQRSNEQRVKLIGIMAKRDEDDEFDEVSDVETEKLYEDFEKEDLKGGD